MSSENDYDYLIEPIRFIGLAVAGTGVISLMILGFLRKFIHPKISQAFENILGSKQFQKIEAYFVILSIFLTFFVQNNIIKNLVKDGSWVTNINMSFYIMNWILACINCFFIFRIILEFFATYGRPKYLQIFVELWLWS